MVSAKTQILQAVEHMDDDTAFSAWDMLFRHFSTPQKTITWDDIEEVEPDEIDMQMIKEAENDPDCRIYISRDELLAKRRLRNRPV